MAENPKHRNVLCVTAPAGPIEHVELDRFRKVVMVEGKWTHPTTGLTIDATPSFFESLAEKHKKYRDRVESFVPLGHTGDPLKNTGMIPSVEVGMNESGKATLAVVFDIKNPEVAAKIRNGEITGVSVGIDREFTVSNPDGSVDVIGPYLEHVALTQRPVIAQGHLGDFQPIVEFDKDRTVETKYWSLAAANMDASFMDPPDAVVNGERLATHDECEYRAGTAGTSCSSCLAYTHSAGGCEFVAGPIKGAGLCDYFRPRSSWMAMEEDIIVSADDHGMLMLASDPRLPYGDVEYGDGGYRDDKVKRFPLHDERHIRASMQAISKEKNKKKYSDAQLRQIRSKIESAWKAKIDKAGPPSAKKMDKEPPMPNELLVSLSKELGIELSGDDPKVIAEAIKAKLTPAEQPPAADPKQAEQLAALAKESGEFKAELERQKNENTKLGGQIQLMNHERRLIEFSARIDRCELTGRMDPADRQKLLSVGNDDKGQPRVLSLNFDRTAPQAYGKEWEDALTRREIKLEAYEERDAYSAVPQEIIPHTHTGNLLDRWTDPANAGASGGKAKTAEELAKVKDEEVDRRAERANGRKKATAAA